MRSTSVQIVLYAHISRYQNSTQLDNADRSVSDLDLV